ncbi:MAG: helix-turn-helix transcriptional regulator [Eubacteriales bacterium]
MKRFSFRFFKRILYANSAIICIVVTCISVLSIVLSVRTAVQNEFVELLENSNSKLQVEENLFSDMLHTADSIFRNQNVSPFINFNSINSDLKDIVLKTLKQYANDFVQLGSIYAYAEYSDYVALIRRQNVIELVSKEEFADTELLDIFHDRDNLRNDIVYSRSINPHYGGGEDFNYTFIGFDGIRMEGGPGYAIVINMPQSWLTGYLFETEIDYSRTVIVDANGYAVTSSSFGEIGSRIDSLDFVEMVLNTDSAGYNISFVDNTAMLIVHSNSNAFGHRIITLKPIAEIIRAHLPILLSIIVTSLVLLIISIFTGYAVLRRVYNPIDAALRDAKDTEQKHQQAQDILRTRFIYNLIAGHNKSSQVNNNELEQLGIPLLVEKPIYLLHLQIDNMSFFDRAFDNTTKEAYFYAIRNVASEIMSEHFTVTSCTVKSMNCIILLMNFKGDADIKNGLSKMMPSLAQRIIEAIKENIELSVSITYLYPACPFDAVTEAFALVDKSSHQRYIDGYGSVHVAAFGRTQTTLSATADQLNIQDFIAEFEPLLISGQGERCMEILTTLITNISANSTDDVQLFHAIVNYSFRRSIQFLISSYPNVSQIDLYDKLRNFDNYETRDAVLAFYKEVINRISDMVAQGKRNHHHDIVNKINQIIDSEYSDPDLSTAKIAEMLQYTPSYIGKLYKSHTNTSIVSRITERRLDASLDLLKKTDINIEALANQCGYSNVTYFYQLFKRKTGVTPGDYRRKFLPNNLT